MVLVLFFILPVSSSIHAQNYAIDLDGVDDRVTVPHHPAYNLNTGNFTLEALVNFPAGLLVFSMPIASKRSTSANGFLWQAVDTGKRLLLQAGGVVGGNQVSAQFPSIYDGNCHHIAVKRTTGNPTLFYVDGVEQTPSSTSVNGINSPGDIYFGYDLIDNNYLEGSISEIRFWNVGRSQTEIQTYMNTPVPNNTPGLIGLWRFNELNGEYVADSSATKNNGYLGTTTGSDIHDPTRSTVCPAGDVLIVTPIKNSDQSSNISLSPNPFKNTTQLKLHKSFSNEALVHVYTLQGYLISSYSIKPNATLTLGDELTQGLYILHIIEGESIHTVRILKE